MYTAIPAGSQGSRQDGLLSAHTDQPVTRPPTSNDEMSSAPMSGAPPSVAAQDLDGALPAGGPAWDCSFSGTDSPNVVHPSQRMSTLAAGPYSVVEVHLAGECSFSEPRGCS